MAVRNLFCYEWDNGFDVRILEEDFVRAGLGLPSPKSGNVVTRDQEGLANEISVDSFRDLIVTSDSVSFEWWFSESADLYCRIQRLEGTRKIKLGLEGTSSSERARVAMAMEKRFLRESNRSLGFVFDPEGWSEDYEWDSFFLNNESLDWSAYGFGPPMTVGIRSSALDRLENLPAAIEIRHENGLTVLSNETVGSPS